MSCLEEDSLYLLLLPDHRLWVLVSRAKLHLFAQAVGEKPI